jgi:hypothetical protein
MTAMTWQQMLAGTSSPDEVIALARDFLAGIDHVQLAKLPDVCKPGKLLDTHDVASYAYDLVRHHCEDNNDPEIAETIHSLSAFFSQAVVRLSQLAAPNATKERQAARLFG